jgi:hypothetical protein
VELYRAGSIRGRRFAGFVIDHKNFGLEEGTLLVDAHDFESPAAFGNKVEAAVGIFLYDSDDFGGASYVGETLLERAYDAESTILSAALRNHFFVAWLEDVERQWSAGEEDDIERKEGDKDVQEISGKSAGSVRALLCSRLYPSA